MENSVHAMKMVFGVIVFSLAIGIALMLFSQARKTSQSILYLKEEEMSRVSNQEEANSNSYRIVGLETVIPTIFDYYNSKSIIYLKKGNYNKNTDEITNVSNIKLYQSEKNKNDIYCFDIEEEKNRDESWTKSKDSTKNFVTVLLYYGTYQKSELHEYFNKEPKFVERLGTITQNDKERTVIEYILIEN